MLPLATLDAFLLVLTAGVVLPAVGSKKPTRRQAAAAVLDQLLTRGSHPSRDATQNRTTRRQRLINIAQGADNADKATAACKRSHVPTRKTSPSAITANMGKNCPADPHPAHLAERHATEHHNDAIDAEDCLINKCRI